MVTALLAEATEKASESSVPPAAFGLLAFIILTGLLVTAFAFRSVGTRH
ncbi:MAG: hypothetical protein NVV57_09955 [Demequina sp.]|jgi:hypothetical protein|nr:hypothetical protein [Demequina sp.]